MMNKQQVDALYLKNLIGDAVEALVAVLDVLEPDPDLEPDLGDTHCDDRESDYLHPHGATADWEGENEHGIENSTDGGETDHGVTDADALAEWRGEVQ